MSDDPFKSEELYSLWKRDPESFESLRQELLDEFFRNVPGNMRIKLQRLQFRIDGIVRKHGTYEALEIIQRMMLDEALLLQSTILGPKGQDEGKPSLTQHQGERCQVIRFPPVS